MMHNKCTIFLLFNILFLQDDVISKSLQSDSDWKIKLPTSNIKSLSRKPKLLKLNAVKEPGNEAVTKLYGVDSIPPVGVNEMIVPKNSTTALICEPIFNENFANKTAYWYKDGKKIANVTRHSNAVYKNRQIEFEGPIPKVGFLIITKIQIEDQGDFWCAREDNGLESERSRIRVAFLQKFHASQFPYIQFGARNKERSGDFVNDKFVGRPFLGETISIECPKTNALPKPTVSWFFDGDAIDFTENRLEVQNNGSLLIHHFLPSDSGTYECVLSNFAGRSSAKIFIGLPIASNTIVNNNERKLKKVLPLASLDYFRNEIVWFLIGCLTTSCIVLLYLIFGIVFFKCSKRGRRQRFSFLPYLNACDQSNLNQTNNGGPPSLWRSLLRIDPNLIPGFRKVVVPASFTTQSLSAEASETFNSINDQLISAEKQITNKIYKKTVTSSSNLQLDSNKLICDCE